MCDTLIQGQKAWSAFELVDTFSDIANGVMAVQEGTMNPTFLVLFSFIGLFSFFAGINVIVTRSQVISGVRKIRDSDEETMNKFKDGAEGGIVTVHNPALQWELTTVEIHISELAATNGVLEDFPSFWLNVVWLVVAFRRPDFNASPQFYVGLRCAARVVHHGRQEDVLEGQVEGAAGEEGRDRGGDKQAERGQDEYCRGKFEDD